MTREERKNKIKTQKRERKKKDPINCTSMTKKWHKKNKEKEYTLNVILEHRKLLNKISITSAYLQFHDIVPVKVDSESLLQGRWKDRTRRRPNSPTSPTGPLSACTASAMSGDGSSRSPASVHRQPAQSPSHTQTMFGRSRFFHFLFSGRPFN